jgi:hypothetical protein
MEDQVENPDAKAAPGVPFALFSALADEREIISPTRSINETDTTRSNSSTHRSNMDHTMDSTSTNFYDPEELADQVTLTDKHSARERTTQSPTIPTMVATAATASNKRKYPSTTDSPVHSTSSHSGSHESSELWHPVPTTRISGPHQRYTATKTTMMHKASTHLRETSHHLDHSSSSRTGSHRDSAFAPPSRQKMSMQAPPSTRLQETNKRFKLTSDASTRRSQSHWHHAPAATRPSLMGTAAEVTSVDSTRQEFIAKDDPYYNQDFYESEGEYATFAESTTSKEFSFSTELVGNNNVIDYSTMTGRYLYSEATTKLPTPFGLQPEHLQIFLDEIHDRARLYHWIDSILKVPQYKHLHLGEEDTQEHQQQVPIINLLTRHGELGWEDMQLHAFLYLQDRNRASQDSAQLYKCLMNSLTEQGKADIIPDSSKYKFGTAVSGTCLLKVIIELTWLNTPIKLEFDNL